MLWLPLSILFLASAAITGIARGLLVRRGLMDQPNARSSHAVPVPRGGGLSIVLVFLCGVAWEQARHAAPSGLAWALIGGGLAIAIIGFLDDHFSLPIWPRLSVHVLAAVWALWCQYKTYAAAGGMSGDWQAWIVRGITLVALVWLTNLFNFMDGIDGIAGVEAVCVSGFGAILMLHGGGTMLAEVSSMLAAASLGFLVWNWPPAKIFMGDVGSGFLGFSLGVLALFSEEKAPPAIWVWLILLAVFAVDSTATLLRRLFSRARWYEAHRSHAYQHAARIIGSHFRVTLAVTVLNVAWLFPLAWLACRYPSAAPVLSAIAIAPLLYVAIRFRAGREDVSDGEAAQN